MAWIPRFRRLLCAACVVLTPLVLSAAVLSLPPSPAAASPSGEHTWRVWILGDSLTGGLYASSEETTFRSQLLGMLGASDPSRQIAPFWHRGCTLARLEMRWPEFSGRPDLLFLEYGINDLGNPGCPQIPEDQYAARFGAMLDRMLADAPGVEIVVGTIPWCGWAQGSAERDHALRYNAMIAGEAEKRGLIVSDLWSATVDHPENLSSPSEASPFPPGYAGDGFHPSDQGHLAIAQAFFKAYSDHHQ